MRNFREYDLWVDGRKYVNAVYDITDKFPDYEKYGLRSQLNRAAVSILLNIAEGASRKSEKDFGRFLEIARGSAFEVEAVLLIASDRNLLHETDTKRLISEIQSLQKRLFGFMTKLNYI